jgi:hypothetical protein
MSRTTTKHDARQAVIDALFLAPDITIHCIDIISAIKDVFVTFRTIQHLVADGIVCVTSDQQPLHQVRRFKIFIEDNDDTSSNSRRIGRLRKQIETFPQLKESVRFALTTHDIVSAEIKRLQARPEEVAPTIAQCASITRAITFQSRTVTIARRLFAAMCGVSGVGGDDELDDAYTRQKLRHVVLRQFDDITYFESVVALSFIEFEQTVQRTFATGIL